MGGIDVTVQPTPETAKLAGALSRVMEIAFGFVNSQAFSSAYELGLFDVLYDGPRTADELASRAGIRPVACRRLLMTLVGLGLVERDGDLYRNSELGAVCSSKSPVNLGNVSRIAPFYHMCEHMTDALREYSPRWQQALGTTAQDAWAPLYADLGRLRDFADLMNAFSVPQGRLIAECFDFTPYRCVMDVAGGPGGQSIEIGIKHPHLRGIVTDFEPVCVVAREHIARRGLADRFTAVAADLMDGPYPSGADVILLGHILHDWSDETCRKILRNCHAALPAGGALLISESVLDPQFQGRNMANAKDLLMLVANESDARERSASEYESLLGDTGFELKDVIHLHAPRDLVIARRR
jgi:DNA-binding Lrp family transcriptional regulator